MGKLAKGLIGLIVGYGAGAAVAWVAVTLLSSNTHDRSLEAVMTAFFFAGPIGAVVGLVVGLLRR
jgi:hypothetical protein